MLFQLGRKLTVSHINSDSFLDDTSVLNSTGSSRLLCTNKVEWALQKGGTGNEDTVQQIFR